MNTSFSKKNFFYNLKKMILAVGVFTIILCVAFIFWSGYSLFYSPTCNEWRPGMTDKEKIYLAVKIINESKSVRVERIDPETHKTYYSSGNPIPYSDVETIFKENPECCKLDKGINGLAEGSVIVEYIGQFQKKNSNETYQLPVSMIIRYDDCKPRG